MSTGLVASTVTPGRTAPEESFATPDTVACARTTAGRELRTRKATAALNTPRIALSLFPPRNRLMLGTLMAGVNPNAAHRGHGRAAAAASDRAATERPVGGRQRNRPARCRATRR